MATKKNTPVRRSPLARSAEAGTVERFLGTGQPRQEQVSEATRAALHEPKSRKYRRLADRGRARIILDVSRYPEHDLMGRVEKLSRKASVPPSHFIALCIQLGLEAVQDGSLVLEDYLESYDGRSKKYKHDLRLEK